LKNPRVFSSDIKKAIVQLKWAVEMEPSDPYARYGLGKAYASVGYYSGAIYEWEIVLKIDPQNTLVPKPRDAARARFKIKGNSIPAELIPKTPYEEAIAWQAKKQYIVAMEKYREIIQQEPFHFQAYNNLGILLYDRGQSREAMELFKKGLSVMPNNLVLLHDLAIIFYKQGKTNQAKQLWERCLELKPDCKPALDALEMLKK